MRISCIEKPAGEISIDHHAMRRMSAPQSKKAKNGLDLHELKRMRLFCRDETQWGSNRKWHWRSFAKCTRWRATEWHRGNQLFADSDKQSYRTALRRQRFLTAYSMGHASQIGLCGMRTWSKPDEERYFAWQRLELPLMQLRELNSNRFTVLPKHTEIQFANDCYMISGWGLMRSRSEDSTPLVSYRTGSQAPHLGGGRDISCIHWRTSWTSAGGTLPQFWSHLRSHVSCPGISGMSHFAETPNQCPPERSKRLHL